MCMNSSCGVQGPRRDSAIEAVNKATQILKLKPRALRIGEAVFFNDQGEWALGRVIFVHPTKDEVAIKVDNRTIYKRKADLIPTYKALVTCKESI